MDKVVCVTGASGFIASWLVSRLLERGYTVRACVRDPGNAGKVSHLVGLPNAQERLQLFKADLLNEGSFDAAVAGCQGVFHTASPFFLSSDDPEKDLIEPAVKGTLNVLNACVKAKCVRRVVLTSSVAAVVFTPARTLEVTADESFFSDPMYCREKKAWYPLSKTEAEMEAWKFSKEHGLDLVTINPSMVVGRLLQATLNTSSEAVLKLMNGSVSSYPNSVSGWVPVKDVVDAHILAYEAAKASGRYICCGGVIHYSRIIDILRKLYPDAPIPTRRADESSPPAPETKISTDKVKSLGLVFTPLEDAFKECVESLIEQKILSW